MMHAMARRNWCFCAFVIALAIARPSAAQLPTLEPGLRVRVTASPDVKRKIAGTLMSQEDTLRIASSATRWHHIAATDVRRIEVSRGKSRLGGAAMGMLGGAASLGGLTLVLAGGSAKDPATLVEAFAAGGAFLGMVIGFAIGVESWTPVFTYAPPVAGSGVP